MGQLFNLILIFNKQAGIQSGFLHFFTLFIKVESFSISAKFCDPSPPELPSSIEERWEGGWTQAISSHKSKNYLLFWIVTILLYRFSFQQLFTAKAVAVSSLSGTLTAGRRPVKAKNQKMTGVLQRLKEGLGELLLYPSETPTFSQMPK